MNVTSGALVGRDRERDAVDRVLAAFGRAWISGLGGVGKSSLAREIYARRGGVWVHLGAARDAADLAPAIAAEVGFPVDGHPTPSALAGWCAARGVPIVVLDAADAVADAARDWVEVVAARVPVLVTSRVALDVAWAAALEPLSADVGAALFLARLPERRVGAAPSLDDAQELVASLGGLPLAIELAAARLAVVPFERLREGLRRSLGLLRDPNGADRRSGSVDATVRWSWERLSPDEAGLLAACGAFEGPFALEGAAAVSARSVDAVIDPLHQLVRLHLVEPGRGADGDGFELHALVRRFARAQLDAGGRADAFRAHAAWCARDARRRPDEEVASGLARVRRDAPELRAVLRRPEVDPEHAAAAALLLARSENGWSPSWDRALAAGDATRGPLWRRLLARRVRGHVRTGALAEALADADLGLRAAQGPGEVSEFVGLRCAALLAADPADAGAIAQLDREIEVAAHRPTDRAQLLVVRGVYVDTLRGDHAAALAAKRYQAAMLTDPVMQAIAFDSIAATLLTLGRAAEALEHLVDALGTFERMGLVQRASEVRGRLAGSALLEGDLVRAAEHLASAISGARASGDGPNLAHFLTVRALLAAERGEDVASFLAEVEASALQGSWTSSRAMLHCVRALDAAVRGVPAPSAPDLGPDTHAAALVRDVDHALQLLRELEHPSDDDRAALADRIDALRGLLDGWPTTRDARPVLLRVLRSRAAARDREVRAWSVAPDGTGFAPPLAGWVDLSRRPTLARVLRALLDGRAWSVAALGAEVWPEERLVGDSMRNRLQVSISTLRKLGLGILLTTDEGYRLDPAVVVETSSEPLLRVLACPDSSR